MSSTQSVHSDDQPGWFWSLLGAEASGSRDDRLRSLGLEIRDGIPRGATVRSTAQDQTEQTFGFKWAKRDTYESTTQRAHTRAWLEERYGPARELPFLTTDGSRPLVVDAGCGAAYSALELMSPIIDRIRYLGIDVSNAVDVARDRFRERGAADAAFMQADITRLPLPDKCVDAVFSEGVLHHTDSTEGALRALSRLIRPGGWFLFYVYRLKGPVREFTDDYVRERLQSMTPQQAWDSLMPLTRLGKALGQLDLEIDIPEPIDILEIPEGRINLQRLFYWHVAKTFYRPDMTLDEMNHINFDWYAPRNAHRQSPESVRSWCEESGLSVERMVVEDAGLTVAACKRFA